MEERLREKMIQIAAISAAASASAGETLEEKVRLAMRSTKDHYLLPGEDGAQFKAACVALLMSESGLSEEDKGRVVVEHKALSHLAFVLEAAKRGVCVPAVEDDAVPDEPIGLMGIWRGL